MYTGNLLGSNPRRGTGYHYTGLPWRPSVLPRKSRDNTAIKSLPSQSFPTQHLFYLSTLNKYDVASTIEKHTLYLSCLIFSYINWQNLKVFFSESFNWWDDKVNMRQGFTNSGPRSLWQTHFLRRCLIFVFLNIELV